MTGIGPKRAEIIVAGVAVLNEVMRSLGSRACIIPRPACATESSRIWRIAGSAGSRIIWMPMSAAWCVRWAAAIGTSAESCRKVAQFAAMLFEGLHPLHRLPPAHGRILEARGVSVQHRPLRQ